MKDPLEAVKQELNQHKRYWRRAGFSPGKLHGSLIATEQITYAELQAVHDELDAARKALSLVREILSAYEKELGSEG